ncbi:MAG TPA: hypothetical protein PLE24_14720 [Chitinispirillaceae bacterium]|mgnify:CR=1 FL=1|jgi:hypothetical protein|nr:hypothetical protein [Chitinispirillaceae bacterium]
MQIKPVHANSYSGRGSSGENHYFRKKKLKRPLDAFIIVGGSERRNDPGPGLAFLRDFIELLPDEQVREKINNLRDSYENIDDFLIDKLIIEEL